MVARCFRNDRNQLKRGNFISVPGTVGKMTGSEYIFGGFEYYMMVIGFFIGYFIVAAILLPLYYKMNLTSIYTYLGKRFNVEAHKIGSVFFIVSRAIGGNCTTLSCCERFTDIFTGRFRRSVLGDGIGSASDGTFIHFRGRCKNHCDYRYIADFFYDYQFNCVYCLYFILSKSFIW